jgi:hypothetical protein
MWVVGAILAATSSGAVTTSGPARPLLTFEYGDLLSEGEDFNGRIGSTPEEDTDRSEEGKDGFEHDLIF